MKAKLIQAASLRIATQEIDKLARRNELLRKMLEGLREAQKS